MTERRLRSFSIVGALVLAALALSHELIYLLAHGPGAGVERAMAEGGHDRYWTSFVATVAVVCGVLAFATIRQIRRLSRQAEGEASGAASIRDGGVFRLIAMTVRLWGVVGPATSMAYLLQENVERLGAGSILPGLGAVTGEHAIALPIIALVSLVVAFVGGLARWRRDVLLARISRASPPPRDRAQRRWRPAMVDPVRSAAAGRSHAVRAPPGADAQTA